VCVPMHVHAVAMCSDVHRCVVHARRWKWALILCWPVLAVANTRFRQQLGAALQASGCVCFLAVGAAPLPNRLALTASRVAHAGQARRRDAATRGEAGQRRQRRYYRGQGGRLSVAGVRVRSRGMPSPTGDLACCMTVHWRGRCTRPGACATAHPAWSCARCRSLPSSSTRACRAARSRARAAVPPAGCLSESAAPPHAVPVPPVFAHIDGGDHHSHHSQSTAGHAVAGCDLWPATLISGHLGRSWAVAAEKQGGRVPTAKWTAAWREGGVLHACSVDCPGVTE
jgi:hypothetical protein